MNRAKIHCLSLFVSALLVMFTAGTAHAEETLDDALQAYQEAQLLKARRIALEHQDKPLGRLVLALCRIHDHANRDLNAGIAGLKELYEDDSLGDEVWTQAALTYGRTVQLLQARDLYPQFDGIDVEAVYRRILKRVPDSPQACLAVMYLAEKYVLTKDESLREKAFKIVEAFLAAYKGDKADTVPVHLFVEVAYIAYKRDFSKSVEHLQAAYNIGIKTGTVEREVLFRIGRILDVKLDRKEEARRFYREFIEKYPDAKLTPVVERYLKEMDGRT